VNEAGTLLYESVRWEPKDFSQRIPKAGGSWIWKLPKHVGRVLYRLPKLATAQADRPVFIVEGEKDVHTLEQLGFLATTNVGGAGKWRPEYSETLRGRNVVILPDNDDPGRDHANRVAHSLEGVALAIRIVQLPDLPPKGDMTDWVRAKGLFGDAVFGVGDIERVKEELRAIVRGASNWELKADARPLDVAADADAKARSQDGESLTVPDVRDTGSGYQGSGDLDGETLAFGYLYPRKRHVFTNDIIHVWSDGRYVPRAEGHFRAHVRKAVADHVTRLNAESNRNRGEGEKPKNYSVSMGLVSNTIDAIKSLTALREEMQAPFWLDGSNRSRNSLVLKNGILDVDRLVIAEPHVLIEHTDAFFTLVVLPYEFNAVAQCPKWLAFLDRNLEADVERIAILQEFFGYCLVPDTSFHKFLLMHGEGANGKSVICAALRAVLGTDNVSTVPLEVFGERFQLNQTLGKLANICAEVGEIDKIAEGHLKSFISGDPMTFERKFKDPIVASPTARLVLATNTLPRFSDRSGGLWRRMIVMPCNVVIQENERVFGMDSPNFWSDELPGILNWSVVGLKRLREQRGFTSSKLVDVAREEYRAEMNPLRSFLTDHFHENEAGQLTTKDVYEKYSKWSDANGYRPLGERMFGREIKRVFPKVERRRYGTREERIYFYVGVAEGPEPPDDGLGRT
jgi:P4 family phage/plasmid primase-like protien